MSEARAAGESAAWTVQIDVAMRLQPAIDGRAEQMDSMNLAAETPLDDRERLL
jgi:hypothetical protein